MKLIVNRIAVDSTSLGGRRYYEGVLKELDWPGMILETKIPKYKKFSRVIEAFSLGDSESVFWSPSQRGPLFASNHIVTVLDCINVEYTYKNDWRLPILKIMSEAIFRNAVAIVAISNATKEAILRNYSVDSSKIIVIPGPTHLNRANFIEDASKKNVSSERFVLMIANSLPHKNTLMAVKAFTKSHAAHQKISMRIVGAIDPEGYALCLSAGVKIEVLKGVTDAELSLWLAKAEFLLSPSLDEGLNLPICEALASNCPILCSDIPVHKEFYDGYVSFFDPNSVDSMVSAINKAISIGRQIDGNLPPFVGTTFSEVADQYKNLFMRFTE
jgi:glycosyltransferase involved in cell wall biosynthesis